MVEQQNEPEIHTTTGVARRLGYSVDTVARMCELGRFPGAYRNGPGCPWKIPEESIVAFKDACRPKVRRRVPA